MNKDMRPENSPLVSRLSRLGLTFMADALREELNVPDLDLSGELRFLDALVNAECEGRLLRDAQAQKKSAFLPYPCAAVQDCETLIEDISVLEGFEPGYLLNGKWIGQCSLIITGSAGSGKTYLACGLANNLMDTLACSIRWFDASALLDAMRRVHSCGASRAFLRFLCRFDILILDNFGISPLTAEDCENLFHLTTARACAGSFLIVSQCDPLSWFELFGDHSFGPALSARFMEGAPCLYLPSRNRRASIQPCHLPAC